MKQIEGNVVDIYNRKIFPGIISINNGRIVSISENNNIYDSYITPGFIDAHVHIESSMLVPEEFSKLAIQKGCVAIVTDPHEIANVLGIEGIHFMLERSASAGIKIFFTIPSCVPSTPYDFSGSCISSDDVSDLINTGKFIGLSEVMNVPGVVNDDPEVLRKIGLALNRNLVVDGHAPGLTGPGLEKYINSGISTDHECSTINEALEKIQKGMKILIREGSAAKNYETLKSLISTFPTQVMFCTDDSHPGDLLKDGHIDKFLRKAVRDGFDLFDILKIASLNPVAHYNLDVGTLRVGDPADFVVCENLQDFEVRSVYINGECKYDRENPDQSEHSSTSEKKSYLNKFNRLPIHSSEISKPVDRDIICIQVLSGELLTNKIIFPTFSPTNNLESDIDRDILKIVYLNRYEHKDPQVAFIHGSGLKKGAFATSISHDSHNIIAVGCNDHDLTDAINAIITEKGGLVVADKGQIMLLPLPIAGIMSDKNGIEVSQHWEQLISKLKEMGCLLESPFMTLSFMALIVIPELKIGEKGLFEYSKFSFIAD